MGISKDEQKILAATTAVDSLIKEGKIFSGMKIGLGTGSTAMPAVKRFAQRIEDGTLKDIKAVATSFQTTLACEELGIPVYTLNDKAINGTLDLAIDGADEIDPDNNLIKGGGAALLREKIIAYNSARFAIVADSSKDVKSLGKKGEIVTYSNEEMAFSYRHSRLEDDGGIVISAVFTLRQKPGSEIRAQIF